MDNDPPLSQAASSSYFWVRFCRRLWQRKDFVYGTVLLGIVLNVVATWSMTPWGTSFVHTPMGTFLAHPLDDFLIGISLLLLTVVIWAVSRFGAVPSAIAGVDSAIMQRNRAILVSRLRQDYQRRLSQSLQGAAMIALGLHERNDVTRSSAQLVFRRTQVQGEHPLPPGTTIVQAYDDAGQGLLLLGAPGAGKTTLLLELACELLTRAEGDSTHPIPVILNLSSWVSKRPPLANWLIDQLRLVYSVPSRLGQTLLEQDHWLLLLDGLDEAEPSTRSQCIEAINLYREGHFAPLIVCTRSHEYLTQKAKLALPNAVEIQPLQEQGVMEYLKRIGRPMAAVRATLQSNPGFKQLLTTPLMLSTVISAYRDKVTKDLPQFGSTREQQRQIFARYAERMLERQTIENDFMPQQTYRWLIWLAQHMQQQHLAEFYLERLQPSWLPKRRSQIFYAVLEGLVAALIPVPLVGVLVGLAAGLISGLITGLLVGLGIELAFVLLHGSRQFMVCREIRPQEILQWSWSWKHTRLMFISLIPSLVLLLGVALRFGIINGLTLLLLSLLLGVPVLLFEGLSSKQVDETMRVNPNQGIHSSGWNALRISLIAWLVGGLLGGLLNGLVGGLIVGLMFVLLIGPRFGLKEYQEHYLLRYVLWRCGDIPWSYVRFLEDACERILLQRVGGGYRFIHPLFQEYFASQGTGASPTSQL